MVSADDISSLCEERDVEMQKASTTLDQARSLVTWKLRCCYSLARAMNSAQVVSRLYPDVPSDFQDKLDDAQKTMRDAVLRLLTMLADGPIRIAYDPHPRDRNGHLRQVAEELASPALLTMLKTESRQRRLRLLAAHMAYKMRAHLAKALISESPVAAVVALIESGAFDTVNAAVHRLTKGVYAQLLKGLEPTRGSNCRPTSLEATDIEHMIAYIGYSTSSVGKRIQGELSDCRTAKHMAEEEIDGIDHSDNTLQHAWWLFGARPPPEYHYRVLLVDYGDNELPPLVHASAKLMETLIIAILGLWGHRMPPLAHLYSLKS